MPLADRRPTARQVVVLAALLAMTARFPGAFWPMRADEAGFTLVARHWDPQPDSLYGPNFVDRPPLVIALFKLGDLLGGPEVLRVVAAIGCGVAVISAAGIARHVAGLRAAAWTAVATAAVCANTLIDSIAAKGEILGVPVILASMWWSLRALDRRSAGWAFAAGFLATLVLGLKQNLFGALAFGGVLLVVSWWKGALDGRQVGRLGGAALAGASLPVLGTIAWTVAAGVRLETLWYTVYGFRGEATGVLVGGDVSAPATRAVVLAGVVLACGIGLIIGGFLVHFPGEWEFHPAVAAATLAVVVVDGLGLALSGSYWTPYAFALVPACALSAALLVRRRSRRGLAMRSVIVIAAASSLISVIGWTAMAATGVSPPTEARTGQAIDRAAEPGDTLVVFGGRADIQYASGLRSPYPYLWSLPMRTLDPRYRELLALVSGPDAPTWLVEWVGFDDWQGRAGERLQQVVEEHYVVVARSCGDEAIWLREGVYRQTPEVDCVAPVL